MTESNPPGQESAIDDAIEQPTPEEISHVADLGNAISDSVSDILIGHREAITDVVIALLARGHVLIEDVPGVGKTMLTRSLAGSIDSSYSRIQFTPDLLPSDITGVNVFNQKTHEFEFQQGPIFSNVVLGDEINRAPPKTQSALLEAMEERQVTVDGVSYDLPAPFTILATRNIVEPHRTYELPIAQLDRFMKAISLGYPNEREEIELLDRVVGEHPIDAIEPVTTGDAVERAQATVADVAIEEPIRRYATKLAVRTRKQAELGASPRGTIALLRAAQARAAMEGRGYVIPDDVQAEAESVLAHRIRPSLDDTDEDGAHVVNRAIETVPVE